MDKGCFYVLLCVTETTIIELMAAYFDPADHEEFTRYVVANQRRFDEIEAQHIASKAAGNQTGNVHLLFKHVTFISFSLYSCIWW